MGSIYEDVEIADMDFAVETETFTYPCPCGDLFTITLDELLDGKEIAPCPSCSLLIKVMFTDEELEGFLDLVDEAECSSGSEGAEEEDALGEEEVGKLEVVQEQDRVGREEEDAEKAPLSESIAGPEILVRTKETPDELLVCPDQHVVADAFQGTVAEIAADTAAAEATPGSAAATTTRGATRSSTNEG